MIVRKMTAVSRPLPHPYKPGSVRAAWTYRTFRLLWVGQALSNVGSWMQNVSLPAYVQARWDSGTLVGLMVFAQLGPLLLFSIPGSVLANKLPRKPWLVTMPSVQMFGAFGMALLISNHAAFWALWLVNAIMGTANALNAPAFQASVPLLVDRRDLPGAISLNSVQLNGSRVVGPVIAGLLLAAGLTVSQLLVINGVTFLFIVGAILLVQVPEARANLGQGWRQLTAGLRIARASPLLARLLLTMTMYSFFCLPFIGLFPTVAKEAFALDPSKPSYSWLYAVFGLGTLLGGLAVGTLFTGMDKKRLIQPSMLAFAAALFVFALLRSPGPAYPVALFVGFAYFLSTVLMNTVFQQGMHDEERTVVMALWFMAFGGTIPIGNLVFGPLIDAIGPRWVLGFGALFAVYLAWWCRPEALRRADRSEFGQLRSKSFQARDAAGLHQHGDVRAD